MSKEKDYKERFKKFLEFLKLDEREINTIMNADDHKLKRIADRYAGYIFTGNRWKEMFKKTFNI